MSSALRLCKYRRRRGFWLVELSVIVLAIGCLVAFGVPRFLQSYERSIASESFKFLESVHAAQDDYHAKHQTYADDLASLQVAEAPPGDFKVGQIEPGPTGNLQSSWRLSLTRKASRSSYGAYAVTFTQAGYDGDSSTIEPDINPQTAGKVLGRVEVSNSP